MHNNFSKTLDVKLIVIYFIGLVMVGAIGYVIEGSKNVVFVERFLNPAYLIPLMAAGYTAIYFGGYYFLKHIKITIENVFYAAMALSICIFCLAGILTHGEACRVLLHPDKTDVFMDFFNSIQYGLKPYENKVIYPPFINLLYAALGRMTLIGVSHDPYGLRLTQIGALVYLLVTIVTVLFYSISCFCAYGKRWKSILFIFVTLLSAPFLYALERGNSVLLTVVLILVFLTQYRSGKKTYRYLSYVALGLAAGIKISPALFGLLLIRERRWKEAVVALGVGAVTFFLPFIFLDGNLMTLLDNIRKTTALFQGTVESGTELKFIGQGVYLNIQNTFRFLSRLFNVNFDIMGNYINLVVLAIGLAEVLLSKYVHRWQVLFILSALLVITPGFSGIYNGVFMVVPLLYFLKNRLRLNGKNILWCIGFLAVFIPWINLRVGIFSFSGNDIYPMNISTAIESMALLIMTISIEIKVADSLIRGYFQQRKRVITITAIFSLALMVGLWGSYKMQPESILAFTPYNDREDRAISGINKVHGIYRYIDREAQITLKADEILDKGLLISFAKSGSLEEDRPQMVDISINGNLLERSRVGGGYNHFVYVSADKLSTMKIEKDIMLSITKEESDNSYPLELLYAGPSKPISHVKENQYIAENISDINDKTLWMGKEGHVLLNTSDLQSGFLVQMDVSEELMKSNQNGAPAILVTGNGKLMKKVPLKKKGRLSIVIQPEDLKKAFSGEESDKPLDLGIAINAAPPVWDEETLEKTKHQEFIKIHYIGTLEDRQNTKELPVEKSQKVPYYAKRLPLEIFTGEEEFFYTEDLEKTGLSMVYFVPEERKGGRPVTARLLLDDKLVKTDEISSQDFGKLRVIHINPSAFDGENHIVRARLQVDNFVVTDNIMKAPLCIIYRGPAENLENLSIGQHKTAWMTKGLGYDNWTKRWTMGRKAQVALVDPSSGKNQMSIKYKVSRYLISANPGDNMGLDIFVNGKLVRHAELKEPGTFTEYIPAGMMRHVETEDGIAVVTLKANATYDPSLAIKGRRTDEERSIDITELGFDEE